MEQFTFRDFLIIIFRQKWVLLTTVITVMLTVTIGLQMKTPIYESKVKLLISAQKQVDSPYYRDLIGQTSTLSLTQSEIVTSNPVIERAVKILNLDKRPLDYEKQFASPIKQYFINKRVASFNEEINDFDFNVKQRIFLAFAINDLKANIKVEPIRDTNVFNITVNDFNPEFAALIANVISRSYVIFDLEQQQVELQMKYGEGNQAVTQLKDNIEQMSKGLNGKLLPNIEAIGPASVKIIEQALPAMQPSGIPKKITFILAIFMSVILGIMLAFLFEYLDQTFHSAHLAENFLGIPCLGSIPKKAKIETFQFLSEQIYLLMKDKKLKSLLFTSASTNEGVTKIVSDISKYLSDKNICKVLIIDANLRNPSINKNFNINKKSLIEITVENFSFENSIINVNANLSILSFEGTKLNPTTIFNSHAFLDIIKFAKEKYDVILIDSPNMKEYKDALSISSYSDAVLFVVNEGKTRKHVAKYFIGFFQERKTCILGFVLNNKKYHLPKFFYEKF